MTRRPDPGAGVFDTLLVQAGEPVALAAHLERLAASVRELYDASYLLAYVATAARGKGDITAKSIVESGRALCRRSTGV